jgi:hypothetical protein
MTIYQIINPVKGGIDYVVPNASDVPDSSVELAPWVKSIVVGDVSTANTILDNNIISYTDIINENIYIVHYEVNEEGHVIIRPVNSGDSPNDSYQVTCTLINQSKICDSFKDVNDTKLKFTQIALTSALLDKVNTTDSIPLMPIISSKRISTGTQNL